MFTGLIPCVTIFHADMYLMQTQHLSLNHISALKRTNEMRRFMGLVHVFVCLPLGSMPISLSNPLISIDTLILKLKLLLYI